MNKPPKALIEKRKASQMQESVALSEAALIFACVFAISSALVLQHNPTTLAAEDPNAATKEVAPNTAAQQSWQCVMMACIGYGTIAFAAFLGFLRFGYQPATFKPFHEFAADFAAKFGVIHSDQFE